MWILTSSPRSHSARPATLLGIPPDTPLVAYLGLMNRYQGTDLLLDAIAHLKHDGVKVRFLIMGFPDERYRSKQKNEACRI